MALQLAALAFRVQGWVRAENLHRTIRAGLGREQYTMQ